MSLKDFIITKNIKRIRREVQFSNFETAKSISVLYCIRNKSDYEKVKQFSSEISKKGINISTLAYVFKPDEIGNNYFGQDNNNFFSDKHITKFGKIKEPVITDFLNTETDILINLCTLKLFYTEYLFALSKAKFKVSGIIDCKYSDLNINLNNNQNLNFLIEQITYYLSVIKQA